MKGALTALDTVLTSAFHLIKVLFFLKIMYLFLYSK